MNLAVGARKLEPHPNGAVNTCGLRFLSSRKRVGPGDLQGLELIKESSFFYHTLAKSTHKARYVRKSALIDLELASEF